MFHVNELNTSYIKMLELLELYLPSKQKLGLMELEQITTKPINYMDVTLRYDHDKF